ncbi:MAG: virulence factor TspB C-terminal domain-related protein [Rugosibacter sp.]|nr:virulence factor TspB C-terminal domain-related protein [Rugosibacter sp.]
MISILAGAIKRFLFGLIFVFAFIHNAYSAFPPAIQTVPPSSNFYSGNFSQAACGGPSTVFTGNSVGAVCASACWSQGYTLSGVSYTGGNCISGATGNAFAVGRTYTCPSGSSRQVIDNDYVCRTTTNQCPPNSTLVSGSCKCNANYSQLDNSSCVARCPSAGSILVSGYFDLGTSPLASFGLRCSSNGCGVLFSGVSPAATSLINGVKHYYAKGDFAHLGPDETCTPSSAPGIPSNTSSLPVTTCALDQISITVNGIKKCVDGTGTVQSSEPEKTKTTTSVTVTNGDGSSTVTNTTTNNYTGETTTTVTNYSSGQTPPTQPADSTVPLEDEPKPDECELNPERVGCKELGTPEDDAVIGSEAPDISITPESLSLSLTCPPDVPLAHGAVFSWQPTCDFAGMLHPIVLLMAWLMAGYIVLGVRQDG